MRLFRRILVPHDFSEHATRALEVAAELAREHGGRLAVLHVVAPFQPVTWFPGGDIPLLPDHLVGGELRRLKALVARTVRGRNAPAVSCKVEMGDPFQRIADAARGVDSVVMATAGRTGLTHLLMGSVAEKVVRHAPVPVLTLRPERRKAKVHGRRRARARQRKGSPPALTTETAAVMAQRLPARSRCSSIRANARGDSDRRRRARRP